MAIEDIIVGYIKELKNEKDIDPSINLFETGILTSLDVLDLISFVENTFKLSLESDDIEMDSFGSIKNIAKLVERNAK